MSQRLKNTLSFANLTPGASVALPHGLITSVGRPLAPDTIFIPNPSLNVASDTQNVTLTNAGPSTLSGDVLVEAWHTIERAFSDVNDEDLPVKPYVVVSVEQGNEPPQPPYSSGIITIYARVTGSDSGDGTLANPYRSFQRAIRDVPQVVPPGTRYIVDITGIGTENLPVNYALPSVSCPNYRFQRDFTLPYFQYAQQVTVRALPQLVASLSPADAVITAAQATSLTAVAGDPVTELVTLTIDAPRASWAADALKGKQLIRTVSVWPTAGSPGGTPGVASCAIHGSDATHLYLTVNPGAFNNGAGPLVMAPGEELRIVEPSATLVAPPSNPDYNTSIYDPYFDAAPAITCVGIDSIGFQGIAFKCSAPGSAPSLAIGGHSPSLELCTVDWLLGLDSNDGLYMLGGNVISGACDFEQNSSPTFFNTLLLNVSSFFFAIGVQLSTVNTVFANCVTIGNYPEEPQVTSGIGIKNSLFKNCNAPALFVSFLHCVLVNVKFVDCAGDAISISQNGYLRLLTVGGTGNVGYGVRCTGDGSGTVIANDATNIGDAEGRAYVNGNNAPVAVWPAAGDNNVDPTTFSRVFITP
jgi:hypothetical protein